MADESRLFVALYVDEDITNELAPALRECGFDAISVFDAGRLGMDDAAQLAWAAENRSALMTCNAGDFLRLAKAHADTKKTQAGISISSEQYGRRQFGQLLRQTLVRLKSVTAREPSTSLARRGLCRLGTLGRR